LKLETRNILVIRLSALGDVAMTIPVLRVFCATYPQVKVTVVSRPFFKPLFDELPEVDFFAVDVKEKHKGLKGLYKLSKELKALEIDAVADFHNVLRTKVVGSFLRMSGIPVKTIDKGRAEKKALTRSVNKKLTQLPTTFERYAKVFSSLGMPVDMEQHRFPKRKEISPKLIPLIDHSYKHHIGIAPFAAFKGKMYPLELMEEIIQQLDAAGETQIFLFGGGQDEIEKLSVISKKYPSVITMAGALSFQEELTLIANLDAMVAMDSGNAHLSAIYGVPTITLWGVTHPFAGFYPFSQPFENALLADREQFPLIPTSVYGNKLPEGYENAMKTITPLQVVDKIEKVIAENKN